MSVRPHTVFLGWPCIFNLSQSGALLPPIWLRGASVVVREIMTLQSLRRQLAEAAQDACESLAQQAALCLVRYDVQKLFISGRYDAGWHDWHSKRYLMPLAMKAIQNGIVAQSTLRRKGFSPFGESPVPRPMTFEWSTQRSAQDIGLSLFPLLGCIGVHEAA